MPKPSIGIYLISRSLSSAPFKRALRYSNRSLYRSIVSSFCFRILSNLGSGRGADIFAFRLSGNGGGGGTGDSLSAGSERARFCSVVERTGVDFFREKNEVLKVFAGVVSATPNDAFRSATLGPGNWRGDGRGGTGGG